jgi:acetyltransferase
MQPTTHSISTGLAFQTRDGRAYTLRRVTPADIERLAEFLSRLSQQTRRLRFMTSRPFSPELVRAEVARIVAGGAGSYVALIVTESHDGETAVAVAELACDHDSAAGEIAVVVRDDAQRKGIGSLLMGQLVQIAQERGLRHLHGDMLAENYPMRRLLRGLGLPSTTTIHSGEIHVIIDMPQREEMLFAVEQTYHEGYHDPTGWE